MTAKDFCIVCYHAKGAGVLGDVRLYGFPPGRKSNGDYQKHLDKVLPQTPSVPYYLLTVPICRRGGGGRTTRTIPVVEVHEALTSELEKNPPTQEAVKKARSEQEWHRSYATHPLKTDEPCDGFEQWPVALYVDGVRFTRQTAVGKMDSFVGFSAYNLVTGKRILLALVRKSELCRCGCRGWCTLHVVFQFLHWSFEALVKGKRPALRHDGSEWPADDERSWPRDLAKALLVLIKGDWAEFCGTFGLTNWASLYHPCPFCDTMLGNMYRFKGLSFVTSPWGDHDESATYDEACRACEIPVCIHTHAQRRSIMLGGRLSYDKRKNGNMGRCLMAPVPQFGLLVGDRLEPSLELPDVADFRTAKIPITVVFWRRHRDGTKCMDAVLHRNPIFSSVLGTSPQRTLAIDTLHTLYYGPIQKYVQCVVWRVIAGNPWRFNGGMEERLELAAARLRIDLAEFLRDEGAACHMHIAAYVSVNGCLGTCAACAHCTCRYTCIVHPTPALSCRGNSRFYVERGTPLDIRLTDLTVKMLGSPAHHALKTKAAELGPLLDWAHWLCQRYPAHIEHCLELREAGVALMRYMELMRTSPLHPEPHVCQEFMTCCLRHLCMAEKAEISFVPKHHMFAHMTQRIVKQGNPKFYSTFLDESLNAVISYIAGSVHRKHWEKRVFQRLRLQVRMDKVRSHFAET